MEVSIIATVILSALGIVFSVAGFYILRNFKHIRNHGKRTKAKVVDILEEHSNDGKSFRLVVEFTSINGEIIKQELNYSTGFKPKKALPYPLEIFYLEENESIKILPANSSFQFILSILFMLVGMACIGILVLEFTGYINIF